jgi:ParB family chromosome partitioning protein
VLNLVDEGKIAMRPAVELSYLPTESQEALLEAIESEDCTPNHAQAIKMRKFAEEGRLSEDVMLSIMQEEKPNQAEQFKMPRERISKYFAPGTPAQKIEETIIRALELLRQRERQKERQRDDAR